LSLALLCAALAGCEHGTINVKTELAHMSLGDDDLVALLPRGLDAVLDVDVAGLRRLANAADLLAMLPEQSLKHLQVVSDHPLQSLDALAVGLLGMGTGEADVVWIARGSPAELRRERVFAALRRVEATTASEAEYHGLPIAETPTGKAAAMLSERTVAYGNRQTVRQVIDIFRADEEGARHQAELMRVLGKAPRAKEGRPAVLAALLLTPPLRERLRQFGLTELGSDADWLAAALAVGDGLDLGLVAGYHDLAVAKEAVNNLLGRAQALRLRPALMFLGVDRYLRSLVAVAVPPGNNRTTPELHLAYRLSGRELGELLDRLARLQHLRQSLPGGG
jgi:hypothetical protein